MKVLQQETSVTATTTSVVVVLAVLCAGLAGATVVRDSVVVIPIALVASALILTTLGRRLETIFLVALVALLAGYALQGRGFAYLGVPPLYVGEIVLLLGIAALVLGRTTWRFSMLQMIIVVYMVVGATRTIPFIKSEGLNAIRDSVLWYYAAFALIVSLILTYDRLVTALRIFAKLLPYLVIWYLAMSILFPFFVNRLPHFPGSPLPIISVMIPGNRAVILSAMAIFFATGLYRLLARNPIPSSLFWIAWLVSAGTVAALNRGGFLAIVAAMALLFLLRPSKELYRAALIGITAIIFLVVLNPTIDLGRGRLLSVEQLTVNISSIFSDETSNLGSVQSTKNWRLDFWKAIYTDIINGQDFWAGKGFGLNLANYYGFQVHSDESLRSPHNSHVTVLGRMGVIGIVLWLGIHLSFALNMVAGYFRNRRSGDALWWRLYLWLFGIWVAMTVEAIFDVYYEAPQGGIWMWSVVGTGIAALRIERGQRDAERTQGMTPLTVSAQ